MKKSDFDKKYREEQEYRKSKFYIMMKNEGFIETVDKTNNFSKGEPLFYKRISESEFLAFNISYYEKLNNAFFQSDFWKIYVSSEDDFLNKKLEKNQYKDIILGFRIERDMDLFNQEKNVG